MMNVSVVEARVRNLVGSLALSLIAAWGTAAQGREPLTLDPRLEAVESERIAAVERAMPSAVSVFVPGGGGGGSGVVISPDGFALTNFHVSSPAGTYMRCGMSDGRIYDAVIVGVDPVGDVALIRLLGREDFPFAELADSRQARVGQWCMVIGNPFLLNTNLKPSVSWGILSGVGRYQYPSGTLLEYADCLQTDASINPGNSGGPLYDAAGRLLGIVGRASFEKRGRVNVGVGYAISIQQCKNFLGDLHSGRVVDHATLGATVATSDEGGVEVSNILETSDAYRRGLRYGNEILEIDGRVVSTANDVQNVIATFPAQWRVKLTYRNQDQTVSTLVRLASVHSPDELLTKMAAALPPPPPAPDPKPPTPEGGEAPGENEAPGELPAGDEPADPHENGSANPADDIPEEAKKLIVARNGYANYHFNQLRQQAFMQQLKRQFPGVQKDAPGSQWALAGTTGTNGETPVTLMLGDAGFELKVGDRVTVGKQPSDYFQGIQAKSPAGLVACLDSWRRMLRDGTEKFGECYYRGTIPLLGERPLRDWMVGISGELETSWLSHPESHLVEAIEVYADRDEDPAELLIQWSDDPKKPPTSLELRYGTESVWKFQVTSWNLETEVAK